MGILLMRIPFKLKHVNQHFVSLSRQTLVIFDKRLIDPHQCTNGSMYNRILKTAVIDHCLFRVTILQLISKERSSGCFCLFFVFLCVFFFNSISSHIFQDTMDCRRERWRNNVAISEDVYCATQRPSFTTRGLAAKQALLPLELRNWMNKTINILWAAGRDLGGGGVGVLGVVMLGGWGWGWGVGGWCSGGGVGVGVGAKRPWASFPKCFSETPGLTSAIDCSTL